MSLHALQCALATLFTDVDARARYDDDCDSWCAKFDLNSRERAQLAALAQNAIASYAATLIRKRSAEASRLLPQVRDALGDRFAHTFDAWASRTPLGEGSERYTRDAAGFCNHLLGDPTTREHARWIKADLSSLRG